jgi:hypothetical protein
MFDLVYQPDMDGIIINIITKAEVTDFNRKCYRGILKRIKKDKNEKHYSIESDRFDFVQRFSDWR